jgi:hypothetical protein
VRRCHGSGQPLRVCVTTDQDRAYFGTGGGRDSSDQLGYLDGGIARFGRSYIGEPDVIAEELARDVAVREADTLMLTVPNQLGVEYNAHLLRDDRRARRAGHRVAAGVTLSPGLERAIGLLDPARRPKSAAVPGRLPRSCWAARAAAAGARRSG